MNSEKGPFKLFPRIPNPSRLTLAPHVVQDGADASLGALESRQVEVLFVAALSKPHAEYPVAIRRQESLHLVEDFGRNVAPRPPGGAFPSGGGDKPFSASR